MTLSDRDSMPKTISRRSVLRYAAAVPAAFAVGGLLAACGGGGSSNGGSSGGGGSDHTVNMTDALKFEPASITIKKGDSITWKNTGQLDHTATDNDKAQNPADAKLPSGAQAWDSGNVGPGKTFKHTFDVAGDYTYYCIPHEAGGMVGHVTVQ